MDYIGEQLLPGKLGHFFIILSLVSSLVATISYFLATRSKSEQDALQWRKLARLSFITEVFSVIAIFVILFYIIYNHLFEYKYAWQHSNLALEFKYLLACFWEGQEGSFLLWSFWHSVLGLVLIRTSRNWEAPVMTVVSFAQFCLATMVAGIYVFGFKVGSNPFILLRDSGVLDNAPALHLNFDVNQPLRPDYLSSITDGNGLNPLLQNRWMVIHPPVLFLGFASTIIPFAFVIAALWTRKYGEWINKALPWSLFSTAVLGVGIMMGAWWAYESLTFGGYWAWDPVENASLVPWLTGVAGLHTMLIYKHTGHSLRATFLFFILTFSFILYSTFLTRSGILGDASVHAFTDLGMNWQLLLFLLIFVIPAFILFFNRYKAVPAILKEESTYSREFWMFIGSLVFFLSAIVIIVMTSFPVFNKLIELFSGKTKTKFAMPEEFVFNNIHIYVAIIIGTLTAISQYFKYKTTAPGFFWKRIALPTIITIMLSAIVLATGNINYTKEGPVFQASIWLGVACAIYAVVGNAGYIWTGLKGKLGFSGGSVAHIGFGLVLLGILISSSKKETLSRNTSGIFIDFGKDSEEKPGENLTLVKGVKTDMGKYWVTYRGDSAHPKKEQWYFHIDFEKKDGKEKFTLQPNAFINYKGNEGLMANPDSKHYPDHDVFTYITSLPDPEKNKDTAQFFSHVLKPGDTSYYSSGFYVLDTLISKDNIPGDFDPSDKATIASITVYSKNNTSYKVEPLLIETKGQPVQSLDTVISENLVFRINKIENGVADIGVKQSNSLLQYVTLKAYKFPMINLLWGGIVICAIGIFMSMFRRIRQRGTVTKV